MSGGGRVAGAHSILTRFCPIMHTRIGYWDLSSNHITIIAPAGRKRYVARQLEALGF
jgi:hypothetical protein